MDIAKFQQLLAEDKLEEARDIFQEFLAAEISPRDQAEAMLSLAVMHMAAENAANREYLEILNYAMTELKKLQKAQTSFTDSANLALLRKQLDESESDK